MRRYLGFAGPTAVQVGGHEGSARGPTAPSQLRQLRVRQLESDALVAFRQLDALHSTSCQKNTNTSCQSPRRIGRFVASKFLNCALTGMEQNDIMVEFSE